MKWLNSVFGGKKMAALNVRTHAPNFELPTMDGSKFSLESALARGPVLAVFFKISCPVCQYALPYFERIYQNYGGKAVTIVGVSQNDKGDTAEFVRKYGITFPVVLDDTKTFPASNAYGLTTVPTAFWISEAGDIEISSESWVRQEFEEIARKTANTVGDSPRPLFQRAEQIADFRAG
jgi:peroxiredoxin